ncbi:MAG: ATP12 family chaperone protein [Hyphomicrobiaceae bacterium]
MTTNKNGKQSVAMSDVNKDDVVESAAKHASDPAAPLKKRFYKTVDVAMSDSGYTIVLDDRPIKTPSRKTLSLPTRPLAEVVAAEWSAQDQEIDPVSMPMTRLANTIIDGVDENHADVVKDVARFAMSDLVCYRAEAPIELIERQSQAWDPPLTWAQSILNVGFKVTAGIMPVEQDGQIEVAVRKYLAKISAFELGPVHIITTMTGSAVLALAVHAGELDAQTAWAAAHIDEDWQISQWGDDAEAKERRARRHVELVSAAHFLAAAKD